MSDDVTVRIYRKGDLARGHFPAEWEDPEGIAVMPAHHREMHLGNPLSRGDDDPVRAFVFVGNRIAGRVCLIPQTVTVAGRSHPVLWGFDLLVSTAFRGKGLATKLIRAWQDEFDTAIGTNVNVPSVGIYRKLNWIEFHTHNFIAIHDSRKFVQGFVRWAPAAALAAPLVDAGLAVRRRLGGGAGKHPLRAETIDSMPAGFDELLGRQATPVVTHRSAAWVNWQMAVGRANAGREYRLYLVRDGGGQPAGYFILQRKPMPLLSGRFKDVMVGALRDWNIFDDERADALSLALVAARESAAWGADATLLPAHDEATIEGMRKLGFKAGEELRTVFHAVEPSPLTDTAHHDLAAWRYTPAEADGLVI
jgi:hypothetical protein